MAYPSYLDAFKAGTLHEKSETAAQLLLNCAICPRRCSINRLKDEKGFCQTGKNSVVCSYFPHHGEEPVLSGTKGSGTIFFSHCNMRCLYCQNYSFSQQKEGREVEIDELADCMLALQNLGCHNINFVTPTHVMPQILQALIRAIELGLNIPLVYNTSGYELPEMIRLLDGIIDIYLPDMRYADNVHALKYSLAPHYVELNRDSVKEMFRQVGRATFDEKGIITRGVIIRHLVLPHDISGTQDICAFIAKEISTETYISLMSQYFPAFKAKQNPPLERRITLEEYESAIDAMNKYGLHNGWIQESGGLKRFAGTHIKKNI